jgi:uncharacterized protein YbjT (DUF2867 family)
MAGKDDRGIVLVCGATGRQGGSVAHELLAHGWQVRALTRDPSQPAARELVELGAEVVRGDFHDRSTLEGALEGCYGCYSVQSFWETGDPDLEVGEGREVAEAAAEAGVRHFVYSSVGGAERGTGIAHFDSKWAVEERVRALDLPATILRPVFFMENWSGPDMRNAVLGGTVVMGLKPRTALQMIAVRDIGVFARMAFENPDTWLGEAIEIAGDALTMPQVATAFSRALGRPVNYRRLSYDEIRDSLGEDYAVMVRWFDVHGYKADIAKLRRVHPGLMGFEAWLGQVDWVQEAPREKLAHAGG